MLMSAGVELPATVWAHGFVSVSGGKISKDAGSELDLDELIDRHGTDAFRYFMVREAPWDGDRDFASASELLDRFDQRYNAELANDLGNLVSRTAAMVHKYRQGSVTAGAPTPLDEARDAFAASYHERMQDYLLQEGLKEVFGLVRQANVYIDEVQPWQLAKEGDAAAERLDAALGSLVRCLRGVAAMLGPFMPSKAAEIWLRMGGGEWSAYARRSGGPSPRRLRGSAVVDDAVRGTAGIPALSTVRAGRLILGGALALTGGVAESECNQVPSRARCPRLNLDTPPDKR